MQANMSASKHMDKHDRPYRCQHPSCAKLQGFTYSGGLLRHEREVHNKHGGPKAQLMCPYEDCKRHAGKGFTRKENLAEHVRRVHTIKDDTQQAQFNSQLKHEAMAADALTGAEMADTPASRNSESNIAPELQSPAFKKLRRELPGASERSASEDVEDLRSNLDRLQADNMAKDERIRKMEEENAAMHQRMNLLEELMKSQHSTNQSGQGQG